MQINTQSRRRVALRSTSLRVVKSESRRRSALRKAPLRVKLGLAFLVMLIIATIFAGTLSPHEPNKGSLIQRLKPPAAMGGLAEFPLGTDQLGRDLLSRVLYGGQISLLVAAISSILGLIAGTALGVLAGYTRGFLEQVIMFLVDFQLSMPFILLAIVAAIALGSSIEVLIGLAALSTWPLYARVCRGVVLSLRERDYVLAARAAGARDNYIMWSHLLPNLVAPVLILLTLNIGRVILLESSLSFLGIGIKPPTASWGNIIGEGRDYLSTAWWLAIIPGTVLVLLTVAIGTIGDWLGDLSDVRIG